MSKSNKHHCTPESLGEQKGDFSPFFHIENKERLLENILKERPCLSFVPEDDLSSFSIFLHKREQERFLEKAKKNLEKRQALVKEVQGYATRLSDEIIELARILSAPPKEGGAPSQSCAHLADEIEEKTTHIRTNILFPINEYLISIKNDNIFFQIEKGMFLLEIARKTLGETPPEWEKTKGRLLAHPPQVLADRLSQILDQYDALECHVASQLLAAAKAAKAQNTEKYTNLLHEIAVALYDSANLIKSLGESK